MLHLQLKKWTWVALQEVYVLLKPKLASDAERKQLHSKKHKSTKTFLSHVTSHDNQLNRKCFSQKEAKIGQLIFFFLSVPLY